MANHSSLFGRSLRETIELGLPKACEIKNIGAAILATFQTQGLAHDCFAEFMIEDSAASEVDDLPQSGRRRRKGKFRNYPLAAISDKSRSRYKSSIRTEACVSCRYVKSSHA